tara:strand:- start:2273 stop:6160 length:3888 start_codon:yes stop_codon:yes gene_type:complete
MAELVGDFDTSGFIVDPDMVDGGLRSKQFATVIDLLGYGEIDSILDVGGSGTDTFRKNVFLNNTPLLNPNGEENFQNVNILFKNGASDQTAVPQIDGVKNTVPVGVAVTKASSVSRTTSSTPFNKLLITMQFPSLQKFEDNGEVNGVEVEILIKITTATGTVITPFDNAANPVNSLIISGKATSPYIREYELTFGARTPFADSNFPLTITVERVTDDSTDSKLQNASNFLSFTEVITDDRAYQGFAYVALRFNAQEFQSFPSRKYRVKGTKIKVPHGTTIDSDNGRVIYPDGYTFNGTFKTDKEWCADPAWILYDILTTDKGFGGTDGLIDEDSLDVFSFYSASAYASELITDPITATTEPRFSCNVILNQKLDAYTLINDLCSIMNAMPFYGVGTLQIAQDRPTNTTNNTSDPVYIFNNSNVSTNGFTYQGTGQRTKYTEVEVAYFDNDTQQVDYELITTDQITALSNAVSKFGRTRKTLKSFACTSRGQANRLGRWFLYSNLRECEVVSFTTTIEAGVVIRPSAIIGIADSMRAGIRRGGRINTGVSTTQIIVDDENNTDLTSENSATLSVILQDGTMESRSITAISGKTITVSPAFSTVPQANSVWAIENTAVEFQTYRVLSVNEGNYCEYQITATVHDVNKYSQVEDPTVAFDPRPITTLINEAQSPNNASATEEIVVLNNRAVSKIFVSWEPVLGVKEYLLEFQFENNNPERIRLSRPSFELFESALGSYTFKIKSYNSLGILSSTTTTVSIQAVGKTALPEDPTGLTSEPVSDQFIRLRFNPSTSVDVTHGGTISVRHTTDTSTNASFANSTEIIPQLSGNISETLVPAITGTYSIKFIDDGGRRSENAALIIVTKPDPQPNQVVVTKREDQTSPPFNGSRVRTVFSDEFSGLVLDGSQFFDNVTDVDSLASFDFLGAGIVSQGFYTFIDDLDLEAVFNLTLERHFKTGAIVVSDLWDSRLTLVDDMPDWDGTLAEDVGAKLQVSTCQGVPTASTNATYSQTQDLITITKSSHGYAVNDNALVNFTNGAATDGFLKVSSVTNANVFVVEAKRQLAEYEILDGSTGQIRFFTTGDHGGLVQNDTVKLVFLTGTATSGDYVVGATLPQGTVQITTSSNNSVTSGTVEFIKIKDSSGNNVTTSGDCNISSAFSPFNIFANGEFTARGFRFRAEIFSNDPDENIKIEELGYTASIKRRTETVNTAIASQCATTSSAKTVSFANSFYTGTTAINSSTTAFLPTIGITLEGAVSGDYFKITSVTGTQFVIETRDSSNNLKDISFKYTAIGFGKGS